MTFGLLHNVFNKIQDKIIGADNMISYDVELGTLEIAGFSKEKLLKMCNFCEISYGSNDPKLSQAGYKTKAEFINEGYSIIPFYYSDRTHAGFVFTKDREITIAYHGTKDFDDVITDLNLSFTVPSFLNDGERMHRGFYEDSWRSLYKILITHANKQKVEIKDLKFNLTGHSMVGAIAKIAALYFNKMENVQNLHVATFSDPRVFDLTGSETYNNVLGERTIRVTQHGRDPVPAVGPGSFGYAHVGLQLRVPTSPKYGVHKIDGYYHAINTMKESDFKSNNSVSLFYYPAIALKKTNCVTFGSVQYVLAKSIGTCFSSELERDWSSKAMESRSEPGQFLSCVNSEKFSTYPTILNI
jgi:hypothetical protein